MFGIFTKTGLLYSKMNEQRNRNPGSDAQPKANGQNGRYASQISKPEIAELPLRAYNGPIHVVRTAAELDAALPRLLNEPVLGFDTETRPAFRKGQFYDPSLIQLATADDVFLIQINVLNDWSPLIPLFESPDHKKAGVALTRDIKELQAMLPFTPAGFVELSTLADEVGVEANGLRPLTAILLGFRISKGAQTSNWAAPTLSTKQQAYAATDAWVGREMHVALEDERKRLRDESIRESRVERGPE